MAVDVPVDPRERPSLSAAKINYGQSSQTYYRLCCLSTRKLYQVSLPKIEILPVVVEILLCVELTALPTLDSIATQSALICSERKMNRAMMRPSTDKLNRSPMSLTLFVSNDVFIVLIHE